MGLLHLLERAVFGLLSFWRKLLGLILPLFSEAKDFSALGRGLRWAVHLILLACVLAGLYYLNQTYFRDLLNRGPLALRPYWLPLLFLLLYALSWLSWWLYLVLTAEETSPFPDVDGAWQEALNALSRQGLDVSELPVFLMLGQPAAGLDALFQAGLPGTVVRNIPVHARAPVKVFANREAIFITCAPTCLIGQLALALSGQVQPSGQTAEEDDPFKTQRPTGRAEEIKAILAQARREGRELSEQEHQRIRSLMAEEEAEAGRKKRPSVAWLRTKAEVERTSARLAHLCQLIARQRCPWCPANGIVVLIPVAATESDELADLAVFCAQSDLSTVRRTWHLRCPIFGVLVDLETVPGFREFIGRFDPSLRQNRIGQRFPLCPDVQAAGVPAMLEEGVRWICQSLLPGWIYRYLKLESSDKDYAQALRANAQLFHLLSEFRDRQDKLARVVARGLLADREGLPMVGGLYLAATGSDEPERAFIAGVFDRVVKSQDYVAWTHEAFAADERYRRWARHLWAAVAFGLLALASLVYYFWRNAGT
ncbi:MAG: hypothetical protein C4297_11850 [Gemmataceae bacterium]